MRYLILILSVTSIIVAAKMITGPSHGKVIMCIIDPWNVRKADDIRELNLCTHLILSYDILVPWDEETGRYEPKLYMNITEIRQKYVHLKILLGISQSSKYYYFLRENKSTTFITKAYDFLVQNNFDGMSMRYVMSHVLEPVRTHNVFMKELKEKLDEKQLLLILTVVASKEIALVAFDYPAIATYSEFIHFQLPHNQQDSLQNALKAHNIHDFHYIINQVVQLGVPSTKILMDIRFQGLDMHLDSKFNISHSEYCSSVFICVQSLYKNYSLTYDSEFGVGIAMNMKKNHGYLIESSRVIANKMRFAMRNSLAGAVIDGVELDDPSDRCNFEKDTYDDYKSVIRGVTLNIPIRTNDYPFFTNIVNEAIIVALDEIDQETKLMSKMSSKQLFDVLLLIEKANENVKNANARKTKNLQFYRHSTF